MESAQQLNLEEFTKAFQQQVDTTEDIRKLASWGDDSNLTYIHLKEQFQIAIEKYDLQRQISRWKLLEYSSKYPDDEKVPHLYEVLKESDEIMNGFLKEIYAHSKNEIFNIQLEIDEINNE